MVAKEAVGIVVMLAVLMMCVLTYAPLQKQAGEQVQALGDQNASNTFKAITNAGWGALNLYSIVPYVVVAMVIIGLILRLAS